LSRDNTINFETYKKTRCIEEAERYQRILNFKVAKQIEFIEKGRINDGADLLRASIESAENGLEKIRFKEKAREVIDKVAERGYEKEAEQLRWILQKELN
jgi:hypothetical protein